MSFKLRQFVLDFLAALLALDEVVDHAALNRARDGTARSSAVRSSTDVGLVAAQHVPHAAAIQTGRRRRSIRCERPSRRFPGHPAGWSPCRFRRLASAAISFSASSMIVSVVSPRKSIFSRPIFSTAFMSIGGHDFVVLGLVQRDQFRERPGRNHHAGGVHPGSCAPGLPASARCRSIP